MKLAALVLILRFASVLAHGKVSRHLVLEDVSTVVILAEVEMTGGPFDAEDGRIRHDTRSYESPTPFPFSYTHPGW